MTAAQWDPLDLIAQYEALRDEATGTASGIRRGHGLTLFVVRGMHAWLEALSALAPPSALAPVAPLHPGAGPVVPEVRAELTIVLAGMVLACTERKEVGGELRG